MFFNNKKTILIIILFLVISIAGCGGFPGCGTTEKNSDKNAQENKEMPEEIMDMEVSVLKIMHQADLIPLVELMSRQSGREAGGQESGEGGGQGSGGGEQEAGGGGGQGQKQDIKLTFEKTILGEVLKREMKAEGSNNEEINKIPGNTEEIWNNIKTTVTGLHDQWNKLEPLVMQENIPSDTVNSLEEALESLTLAITEHNYFDTLSFANELTGYLSKISAPFAQNAIPAVNEQRYHVRNILLSAANNNFEEARGSLNYIMEHSQAVTSSLKEREKKLDSLNMSIDNLRGALDEENLGLINIKAAIVMDELVKIKDEIKNSAQG
ncbi:MAG TPA: hypothetical protein GX004_06585 [Firmicutes bacterium]|jgi:hypothetical protein|nr:hypothetical protein [Bacillota bacterium]